MKDKILKSMQFTTNFPEVANKIASEHLIIYCGDNFYEYSNGCYYLLEENKIKMWIKNMLQDNFTSQRVSEVINCLKADKFIDLTSLNYTDYLNLQNGLLNLSTFDLLPHKPETYSTIQLSVKYDINTACNKWLSTLDEIFLGDESKISILQEFFGLCLTKEAKYQKALFCVGEGANGKSTIISVLMHLLGEKNYTSIALENLQNNHYIASLFGKLVNISIETNAKSSVYDSVFKAIISGDSLTADQKFKNPITFKPFCKLIFAVNGMPRADDKTKAFFRRLLILRFEREFEEKEQNKNLINELLKELDGIFIWCLAGLKRLRERGYFEINNDMKIEIDDYRKENNNVIMFIEEECELATDFEISKQKLYKHYVDWCEYNGYKSLSKHKFGKELTKYSPHIYELRTAEVRNWIGIKPIEDIPKYEIDASSKYSYC